LNDVLGKKREKSEKNVGAEFARRDQSDQRSGAESSKGSELEYDHGGLPCLVVRRRLGPDCFGLASLVRQNGFFHVLVKCSAKGQVRVPIGAGRK